jgi:hypothetical protein
LIREDENQGIDADDSSPQKSNTLIKIKLQEMNDQSPKSNPKEDNEEDEEDEEEEQSEQEEEEEEEEEESEQDDDSESKSSDIDESALKREAIFRSTDKDDDLEPSTVKKRLIDNFPREKRGRGSGKKNVVETKVEAKPERRNMFWKFRHKHQKNSHILQDFISQPVSKEEQLKVAIESASNFNEKLLQNRIKIKEHTEKVMELYS